MRTSTVTYASSFLLFWFVCSSCQQTQIVDVEPIGVHIKSTTIREMIITVDLIWEVEMYFRISNLMSTKVSVTEFDFLYRWIFGDWEIKLKPSKSIELGPSQSVTVVIRRTLHSNVSRLDPHVKWAKDPVKYKGELELMGVNEFPDVNLFGHVKVETEGNSIREYFPDPMSKTVSDTGKELQANIRL